LSLRKRKSLSQKEIVSVSEADCLLFARRTSFLFPRKAVSVSEGGRLSLRKKLPLHFLRERLALSQRERRPWSRGEVACLLFIKRILSWPQGGCFCLRENVLLRFRKEWSSPQKQTVVVEMVSVSERDCPSSLQREVLCLRRRMSVSQEEIASHVFREKSSLSQKEIVCVSGRDCLSFSQREIVSASEGGCLRIKEKLLGFCQRDMISFAKGGSVCLRRKSSLSQNEMFSVSGRHRL
jgi:hypothetical protein